MKKLLILPAVLAFAILAFFYFQPKSFRPFYDDAYFMKDEVAGHVHRPDVTREFVWPEHEAGVIRMVTNNLGFRSDEDTRVRKADGVVRVLVTGDSHTDGLVENHETFCALLEKGLNDAGETAAFEVINGGTGIYGPYNYRGMLSGSLHLNPDLFLVVFYSGNDFLDGLRTSSLRRTIRIPRRPRSYYSKIKEANRLHHGSVWQAFNQDYFFANYPEWKEEAVSTAVEQMLSAKAICDSSGISFAVATLPRYYDFPNLPVPAEETAAARVLGLTRDEIASTRLLTQSFEKRLRGEGVRVIDLSAGMDSGEGLYWQEDHHLNVAGHEAVAAILYDELREVILTAGAALRR
ncbi:MAG: SGNH/GDSL hydrolase family protein [Gemmatimonadetes bacterium]|nr:SGNH/GDSL hydrolase family protein [Gemmatimonadota bacterium]